jgi:hypothetical protein
MVLQEAVWKEAQRREEVSVEPSSGDGLALIVRTSGHRHWGKVVLPKGQAGKSRNPSKEIKRHLRIPQVPPIATASQ